jgi:hypothetical protein
MTSYPVRAPYGSGGSERESGVLVKIVALFLGIASLFSSPSP